MKKNIFVKMFLFILFFIIISIQAFFLYESIALEEYSKTAPYSYFLKCYNDGSIIQDIENDTDFSLKLQEFDKNTYVLEGKIIGPNWVRTEVINDSNIINNINNMDNNFYIILEGKIYEYENENLSSIARYIIEDNICYKEYFCFSIGEVNMTFNELYEAYEGSYSKNAQIFDEDFYYFLSFDKFIKNFKSKYDEILKKYDLNSVFTLDDVELLNNLDKEFGKFIGKECIIISDFTEDGRLSYGKSPYNECKFYFTDVENFYNICMDKEHTNYVYKCLFTFLFIFSIIVDILVCLYFIKRVKIVKR